MTEQDERVVTLAEISEMTTLSIDTLRWLRHVRRGPRTFKLGRRVVAYESDVREWIDQQRAAESPLVGAAVRRTESPAIGDVDYIDEFYTVAFLAERRGAPCDVVFHAARYETREHAREWADSMGDPLRSPGRRRQIVWARHFICRRRMLVGEGGATLEDFEPVEFITYYSCGKQNPHPRWIEFDPITTVRRQPVSA